MPDDVVSRDVNGFKNTGARVINPFSGSPTS
jgi:hypothetical protein